MEWQTTDPYINPSDETIRLGPLALGFLLTGDDSNGSIAAFELVVPAHSHDHYDETTGRNRIAAISLFPQWSAGERGPSGSLSWRARMTLMKRAAHSHSPVRFRGQLAQDTATVVG